MQSQALKIAAQGVAEASGVHIIIIVANIYINDRILDFIRDNEAIDSSIQLIDLLVQYLDVTLGLEYLVLVLG